MTELLIPVLPIAAVLFLGFLCIVGMDVKDWWVKRRRRPTNAVVTRRVNERINERGNERIDVQAQVTTRSHRPEAIPERVEESAHFVDADVEQL